MDARILESASRIEGWMEPHELEWLASHAATRKTIIELGSWKGRSTKALSMATSGIVFAVDHWLGSESERSSSHSEAVHLGRDAMLSAFRRNLWPEIKRGTTIPIVGLNSEVAPLLRRLLDGRGLMADMLFIDSDHSYERVKEDIATYAPMVAPGGLICGHDYHSLCQGVIAAVNEAFGGPGPLAGSIWSAVK